MTTKEIDDASFTEREPTLVNDDKKWTKVLGRSGTALGACYSLLVVAIVAIASVILIVVLHNAEQKTVRIDNVSGEAVTYKRCAPLDCEAISADGVDIRDCGGTIAVCSSGEWQYVTKPEAPAVNDTDNTVPSVYLDSVARCNGANKTVTVEEIPDWDDIAWDIYRGEKSILQTGEYCDIEVTGGSARRLGFTSRCRSRVHNSPMSTILLQETGWITHHSHHFWDLVIGDGDLRNSELRQCNGDTIRNDRPWFRAITPGRYSPNVLHEARYCYDEDPYYHVSGIRSGILVCNAKIRDGTQPHRACGHMREIGDCVYAVKTTTTADCDIYVDPKWHLSSRRASDQELGGCP